MSEFKILNVAIVGGGPGCKAIMDMIFAAKLSQLRMKLIGVACNNPKAVGYRYAQEKNIYTTSAYSDLYELKDLNMIIELTGRPQVANEISRTKPDHIRLMDHVAARLFWDVFQIEEQRLSDRQRAVETIREGEAKSRLILQTMPSGLFTVGLNRKISTWTKGAQDITGLKAEQVIGKDCIAALDCDACKKGCALFDDNVDKPIYDKECIFHVDGRDIIISKNADILKDSAGNTIGGLEIFVDISDRKRAEEALRKSEARLKSIVQTMPSGLFTVDLNKKITFWNKEAEEIVGLKAGEVIGKDCIEALDCDECKKGCALLDGKVDKPIYGKECVIHVGGRDLTILKNVDILRDLEGNTIGGLESFIDITDRKRLEAQLQHAEKIKAIGTLAGGIAHDFNNLLMGVQGNVSLMVMDIDPTHPYYKRLRNIEKQIQSGSQLTSHLLGYARKGRYELRPFVLNELVEEASETFRRTKKEITIHRKLAEDLLAIEADSGQIEQVLLNLFVNAADAMPGGGDLILQTKNVTHKEIECKLDDPKPGSYVLLMVTDTGIGMDNKILQRIFDPFFTTKEMGRGTGLGLASAYGIIKGHGGYIDVDSKKGHGTTFRVYLPASEKQVRKAVSPAVPLIKGTESVLLVDDEEVVLEIGQELLEAMGYRVLSARNGEEAIEVYEKNQDDIDIVVLDMIMPSMGGGEAYDRIKEFNPDVKVLLSSGFSIDGKAAEILRRGCNGFIQKPFTMNELSQKIREILDNK